MPETRRPLHRVVKATGWVSFFTDLGSEIIYPLLPAFVTLTLGASVTTFGVIEGLAEGVPSLIKYFSGAMADRVRNRKWLMLTGYAISSAVKPFIGLAKYASLALAPGLVLALRVLDKVGKGIRGAPRDALVADHAEQDRGRAFGYQRAMDHSGAVAGGLVAFFLLAVLKLDIAVAIACSALPGLLSVLTIVFFVHDKTGRQSVGSVTSTFSASASATSAAPSVDPGKAFRRYLVAAVLFALANSSDAFLLLRARDLGLAVAVLPLAWSMLHVVKALTSYAGGSLSDRVGRKPLLLGGWLLYALVYAGFSFAEASWAPWALFAVYGVFFGATEGVTKAFVADLIPAGARGRAFGMLGMLEGLCLIPSSMFVGWLWDRTGSGSLPLALNAGFAVLAAIWLALMVRRPAKV